MRVDMHKFSITELFSNSCGKSSMSLCMAPCIVLTGCAMGMIAATGGHSEIAIHALGFVTVGGGLLATRRFTKDKDLAPQEDDKPK